MNDHAEVTESEAIKHNIKDTRAVAFHLSPWHDYWILVLSHLGSMWVCVCVCVMGLGVGGCYVCVTEGLYVCRCFDNTWQTVLLSWIPISLSIINPGPITPVVITEILRYIQVQQCVSVESHKEVMNKSIQTIGSSLENITLCTHALWQLIEGSPWAECSTDIIIKDPVLVLQ